MSRLRRNVLKLVTFTCIWILILIVILKFMNSDGRSYYYGPMLKRIELDQVETRKLEELEVTFDEELLIDNSISVPQNYDWLEGVQKELPNVPFDFWIRFYKLPQNRNTTCNDYPYLLKLNFHNIYWQTYQRENITFQLYAAYYDKRANVPNGPVVRVLAMLNQKDKISFPENYCQLWYDNSIEPTIEPVLEYHRIYPDYWDLLSEYFYPYLITCAAQPKLDKRIPRTVSIVKSNCETAKNNLRIWYEELAFGEPKREFAVCVKGLNFPYTDNSARLVEWIEMLRILGASKVFMYHLATHPNVTKVLSYYEKTGFVDVRPITLAIGEPSLPHYQHQLLVVDPMNKRLNEYIPYNDCLYRNMYKFEFLAALDIDEIIMPLEPYRNWQNLIERAMEVQQTKYPACNLGFASICFLNTYFPEDSLNGMHQGIPKFMHMLQHTSRLPEHSTLNEAIKCFHNTSNARTLHNHFALTWLNSCRPMTLNARVAQLQHYRNPPEGDSSEKTKSPKDPTQLVRDTSIWRFKKELILKSQQVLRDLGFLKPHF